jgi:hypothetical protein
MISLAVTGWWAGGPNLVTGLALPRVDFRLSAKKRSVPRVKLSAELI